jgi:hypothetical protein
MLTSPVKGHFLSMYLPLMACDGQFSAHKSIKHIHKQHTQTYTHTHKQTNLKGSLEAEADVADVAQVRGSALTVRGLAVLEDSGLAEIGSLVLLQCELGINAGINERRPWRRVSLKGSVG